LDAPRAGQRSASRAVGRAWPSGDTPSAEVLARLGRGEDVDASEYTFRTSTKIEVAAPQLDWLNKGIFISVGGRQADSVIYETYLVEWTRRNGSLVGSGARGARG
jgi:hypothetical protein